MRAVFLALMSVSLSAACPASAKIMPAPEPQLEVIAELDQRPANITATIEGRVFITMHPFDKPRCQLLEVLPGGKTVPFPDEKTSCGAADGKGAETDPKLFHNIIAVHASLFNGFQVLDMGTKDVPPYMKGVATASNNLGPAKVIPPEVRTEQSFLQDFAFDWLNGYIYVADMGQADLTGTPKPAILRLRNEPMGSAYRLLAGHPSVMPPAAAMQAEGKDIMVMKDGKPVQVHGGLNPITIDPQRGWLYYGPMSAGKIYRVPLAVIGQLLPDEAAIEKSVEVYADKPASDGMTIDAAGNIYLTSVNSGEIGIIDAATRTYRTYLKDARLVWPDGFAFGPDGMLYVTINQLNRAAPLNLGKDAGVKPYLVARFKPVVTGTVGR